MTKKLRIDSRGLLDDKDLNVNVVTNSAGHKARRVKLQDGTIVWEVQAPDHLWSFEEQSGDFQDEVNQKTIVETEITNRVTGLTDELGQAIELDAGFEILTSDIFPVYSQESFEVGLPEIIGYGLFEGQVESFEINHPVVGNFSMREPLVNYTDGLPEEFEVNLPTIGNFSMNSIVKTYQEGLPEEFEINLPIIGNFSMDTVVIDYQEGDAEEFEINLPTIGDFSMS